MVEEERFWERPQAKTAPVTADSMPPQAMHRDTHWRRDVEHDTAVGFWSLPTAK